MRRLFAVAVLMAGSVACAERAIESASPPPASIASSPMSPAASPTQEPIGRLPDDCEPGPDPVQVSDHVGAGIGGDPAWAIGFGSEGTLGLSPDDPYRDHGWLRKVLWLVQRTNPDPITVTGRRVDDGSPIWFAYPGPGAQEVRLVLDPSVPDGEHGDWLEYRGYLVLPAAGCYRLTAAWNGGAWELDFSAGLDPRQS